MKDLRELLLIDSYEGGHIRDNDCFEPWSQGALVLSADMESVLHVGPQRRRVVIPATELSDRGASEAVDQLLWTAAYLLRGGVIPVAHPGGLLDELHKQVPFPVQKLYAKPGTSAWDRAVLEAGGLPVIEALGG